MMVAAERAARTLIRALRRGQRAHALRAVRQFAWLKLVPAKWRCLVPGERRDGAQSRPPAPRQITPGHISLGKNTLGDNDANRWAARLSKFGGKPL
jgi:hypothetical protein